MTEKYVSIDINDPRSLKIAEALSNPTCKKILNLLAEQDMSATDISNKIKLPLNTIGYNLDKLIDSGLIEKSKDFFWSVKGKKIPSYKLSNKKIMISPKSLTARGIIPALLGSLLVTAFLASTNLFNSIQTKAFDATQEVASGVALTATNEMAKILPPNYCPGIIQTCSSQPVWAWFILGSLFAILFYLIWNSTSRKMKGGNNG
jgi:DNA-binding transcriptional ArsR family regulator